MVGNELLKYAVMGVSYLISMLEDQEIRKIKQIIIFGSVARGNAIKDSDIDIFFDVIGSKKSQTSFRSKLNKNIEQFYLTNIALSFKMKSIQSEFSVKVGKLEEWKDLASSISSYGIVLYGKYTTSPPDLKGYTILSWENPGKAKGALLNKFYGYKAGQKRYPGLIKKYAATKIGPATIMINSSIREVFIDVLAKYGVNYSRYDVWTE